MADISVTAANVEPIHPDRCVIYDFIAGEALTKGQAVYQIAASGKAGVADANAAGKQQFRGIALETVAAGQPVSVLKEGAVSGYDLSGMAYDAAAYLSDTAGALGTAAGTLSVVCGRVVGVTDASVTKGLYICADWLRAWA